MPRGDFVELCLELLAPLGALRARRMFGGHGLYLDDLFFGLIAAESLYLKVNASTREQFAAVGCRPFVYAGRGKTVEMNYWSVPAEAMESPALMQTWGRLAVQAALAARQAPALRRRPAVRAGTTGAAPKPPTRRTKR